MGLFGWISGGISAVCNAVTSIGSAIASFAREYAPRIIEIVGRIGTTLSAIGKAVSDVCLGLNILRPNENVEEIGDRALQAAEQDIRPEKFDKYDEYMERLRNFELDPEKSQSHSPENKIMAGLGVTALGLEHRLSLPQGTGGAAWLLIACNPAYFTSERLLSLLQGNDPARMLDFFQGKLGPAADSKTCDELIEKERSLRPQQSTQAIYGELMQARQNVQNASQT